MGETNARYEAICAERDAFWGAWGESDPDFLVPIVNPAFQGFPAWPGLRQAYRTVRRGSLTLLATDGLADLYDDDPDDEWPGLGLEFYVVTKDAFPDGLIGTWVWDLLFQVGATAAEHGRFRPLLEEYGSMSLEVHDVNAPDDWKTENGTVGLLIGAQDPGGAGVPPMMDVPPMGVRAVNLKLLTLDELAYVAEYGVDGRNELLRRFTEAGQVQRSGLSRPSVFA